MILTKLTVTPAAQEWFKKEVNPPENLGIRFFGKVYGKTEVHEGFSIGLSVEEPENVIEEELIDGMKFFIEEADEWFFKGYDLVVDYDAKKDEPAYHFEKND
ncbi:MULTISPECIES: iron-sulfur cluster biosynthesis protein [unclassified Enterococcus]|uniref:Iron-sulfur cluster biosynthesis protein n=2 Tax=root TaxID=1 RepID=A0ABS3I2R2_9ENTE|nr:MULTISPECIES: iron-sulfur cluster biosynthesis protein [unclassified Enterococcus]MBO0431572.1 iron-sulfur cluster biosynthesis protein [Enterococcus sp. DIV0660C]MBO0483011.1 iron-sulfur cluster biosynthesis protein [Enterococcus sp. MSG2901]OJG96202.1 hypothetical protein RV17_GL000161 [Enterococcus thailandicus]OTP23741.1 hypothetical protein A5800_001598 [Enterococcus sp. 5B7_DIV0075]